MTDIVINHRVCTTQGHRGMYNHLDGTPLPWIERVVTSSTVGLGHVSKLTRIEWGVIRSSLGRPQKYS